MTAEMSENNGVLECCKIEFEGKTDLSAGDLSSCGDLLNVDDNGVVSNEDATIVSDGDVLIGEGKGDADGSYVFVNGGNCDLADDVVTNEGDRDLNSENVVDQTEIVETKLAVEGISGLDTSVSITKEKQIESEGFGDEKEMNGESCEGNGCSVAELPASDEETVVENSNIEECVDISQVGLDGSEIELKHSVDEENEAEVRCIEQVDVGVQLDSAQEEEMSQESQTMANEAAVSELPPTENEDMETLNSVDEIRGEDLQINGNEDMDPPMKLEADHNGVTSEITTCLVDDTELEPQSITDKDCFLDSESIEGSNVTPNSVNDAVDIDIGRDGSVNEDGGGDRSTGEEVEGSEEIHQNGTLSSQEDPDLPTSTSELGADENRPIQEEIEGSEEVQENGILLSSQEVPDGSSVTPNSVNEDNGEDGSVNGDGDGDRPIGEEFEGSDVIHHNGTLPSQEAPDLSTSTSQLGADEERPIWEDIEGSEAGRQNRILHSSQEVPNVSMLTSQLGADGDRPICEVIVGSKEIQQDGILPSIKEVSDVSASTSQLIADGDRSICEEVLGSEEIQQHEILPSQEDPDLSTSTSQLGVEDVPTGSTALNGQKGEDAEVVKKHYLIVIPRHIDDKIRAQIRHAQSQVDEKTQSRDCIKAEIQMKRATRDEYRENFEAAKAAERAARDAANAKRQEIDSVQLTINRMKSATSIEEIDDRIHGMKHMIEHETMPLKDEKQLIREIKQLKVSREQLCASMGKHTELQEAFDQKDKIEERFKLLKQELDSLRNEVLRTESLTKAHKKKYADKCESLKELQIQWVAADNLRQDAYTNLQNLRKQEYERNNLFRQYKEDFRAATEHALAGDREALQCHCSNQVERVMELWNKNDAFRKQYIKDNLRSTLRRFRTLDGRSIGSNEEPPVLANLIDEENGIAPLTGSKKNATLPASAAGKAEEKTDAPAASESVPERPVIEVVQKSSSAKAKKLKSTASGVSGTATVSGRKEEEVETEKENERTKEEEELVRKVEELRREEAAARLKEQCRLEEMAKAKEAMERKKRNAEKASARAELRVQKEAELKEKEREKRARKKARKKALAANSGIEEESAPTSDITSPEIVLEPETKEKSTASTATKRPTKSSTAAKQAKPKPLVLPPRLRGKRKMPTWVWILVLAAVFLALVLVSNGCTFKLGLLGFGF